MEQFIVSARKYRPTTFEDVVGQQAITKTLENAIASNHLAQALLFTGPRGVGKTTCARILAKRINQDGSQQENEDFAFNIFELDAASNNSVDDIRSLIDQVRIPPQVGKYKVYIIDEVHMLSTQAFNAFLKTLEEPPKHAIFILATTEKHKIIPTILSRCQIFDFKRIGILDIKEHLARVAAAEGIEAEDDALHIIAQKADGALRDALSTFDRVVSFSGKKMTREAVTENLNVLDYTWFFKMTDLLLENNIPEVLLTYNDILSRGFDGQHFIMGLASHCRDLMVCKTPETVALLEVGDQTKGHYLAQSQKAPVSFLIRAIDLANRCDLAYKTSENQRLHVELCLMQIASLTDSSQKKNLVDTATIPSGGILPPKLFKTQETSQPQSSHVAVAKETENPTVKEPEKPTKPQIEKPTEAQGAQNHPKPIETQEPPPAYPPTEMATPPVTPSTPETDEDSKVILPEKPSTVSIFSLKSIEKKHASRSHEKVRNPIDLPTESFTQDALVEAWNEYAKQVEATGKHNLLSHLNMEIPTLGDNNTIHLVFPNHTIKSELEAEKGGLLNYLRNRLNNHKIDLDIEVSEVIKKKFAYTPQEKFDEMKEKNPLVQELRNSLGLDF